MCVYVSIWLSFKQQRRVLIDVQVVISSSFTLTVKGLHGSKLVWYPAGMRWYDLKQHREVKYFLVFSFNYKSLGEELKKIENNKVYIELLFYSRTLLSPLVTWKINYFKFQTEICILSVWY